MKPLAVLLLITTFLFSCHPQSKPPIPSETIEGNLPTDSIVSISCSFVSVQNAYKFDERNNNKKYLAETSAFDIVGNLVEHKSMQTDGQVEEHTINIYENGKLKETYRLGSIDRSDETLYRTYYYYQPDGKLSSTETFDYVRRLKPHETDIISESDYEKNKTWRYHSGENYTYDAAGNLVEKVMGNDKITYQYDNRRNVVEEIRESDYQTLKIKTTYFTDSSVSVATWYNQDGSIDTVYGGDTNWKRYDKNKNLLDDQSITTGLGPGYRRLNTYDSQNRIIKEEYVTNIGTSIFTVYEYEKYEQLKTGLLTVYNH